MSEVKAVLPGKDWPKVATKAVESLHRQLTADPCDRKTNSFGMSYYSYPIDECSKEADIVRVNGGVSVIDKLMKGEVAHTCPPNVTLDLGGCVKMAKGNIRMTALPTIASDVANMSRYPNTATYNLRPALKELGLAYENHEDDRAQVAVLGMNLRVLAYDNMPTGVLPAYVVPIGSGVIVENGAAQKAVYPMKNRSCADVHLPGLTRQPDGSYAAFGHDTSVPDAEILTLAQAHCGKPLRVMNSTGGGHPLVPIAVAMKNYNDPIRKWLKDTAAAGSTYVWVNIPTPKKEKKKKPEKGEAKSEATGAEPAFATASRAATSESKERTAAAATTPEAAGADATTKECKRWAAWIGCAFFKAFVKKFTADKAASPTFIDELAAKLVLGEKLPSDKYPIKEIARDDGTKRYQIGVSVALCEEIMNAIFKVTEPHIRNVVSCPDQVGIQLRSLESANGGASLHSGGETTEKIAGDTYKYIGARTAAGSPGGIEKPPTFFVELTVWFIGLKVVGDGVKKTPFWRVRLSPDQKIAFRKHLAVMQSMKEEGVSRMSLTEGDDDDSSVGGGTVGKSGMVPLGQLESASTSGRPWGTSMDSSPRPPAATAAAPYEGDEDYVGNAKAFRGGLPSSRRRGGPPTF